jgi:predicted transcriptional regulator
MEDILHMTHDLVRAQIAQRNIDADSIYHWLRETHVTLSALWEAENAPRPQPVVPRVDWRGSIGNDHVTCLVCGTRFRQIGNKHLSSHGLTVSQYRERYGIPEAEKLSARDSTRRRREIMQAVRPWEQRRRGSGRAR